MTYKFTVPGPAVPQGRPRLTTIGGHPRAYDPPRSRKYKAKVRAYAQRAGRMEPITGPVKLTLEEYRPIPKSWSKNKREAARTQRLLPTTRPDMDNVEKAIMDALNGLAWNDDAQVVLKVSMKVYSDDPRVAVEVDEIYPCGISQAVSDRQNSKAVEEQDSI